MLSENILWRAHGCGAFMTNKQGATFSETNELRIVELRYEQLHLKNYNGNNVKWTAPKQLELDTLIARKNAPPELSDTAKAFVEKTWLSNEKGIYKRIKSKYLEKGLYREEEAITLLTEVYGEMYEKNEVRTENGIYTGICDIKKKRKSEIIIRDTKCCWDAETFMNSKPSLDNIVQGQVYLELENADIFYLDFCLLDCPEHILAKEKESLVRKYQDASMTIEEMNSVEKRLQPEIEQLERNLVYSTNERILKEECVKTFVFERDSAMITELNKRQQLGRDYYKTIKLNNIR